MKKIIILLIVILTVFTIGCTLSFSQNAVDKEVSVKDISVGSNTFIHIRELFEKLNLLIKWIDSEKAVLMHDKENFIKLQLNDDYFIFNGKLIKHKVKPVIREGKFYVETTFLKDVFNDFEYNTSKDLLVFNDEDMFKRENHLPSVENKEKLNRLVAYRGPMEKDFTNGKRNLVVNDGNSDGSIRAQKKSKSEVVDHSETNIQVRSVDEADIVKTDGSYLYALSNNSLYIVKSAKEDFRVVKTLKFDNYTPIELYIKDDKLITIGYFHGFELNKQEDDIDYRITPRFSNALRVLIYDISDRSNPSIIRNVELDGNYLSSRLIGNHFYLVANKNIYYRDRELRPYYKDSIDNLGAFIDYKDIKYFPESIYNNYLITLGLDLNNLASSKIDINAYLGSGSNMYASRENMYIGQTKYRYNIYDIDEMPSTDITSSIFKFKLENGRVTYSTKGEVPGKILNQFSMDEHNGNFRIATTKEKRPRSREAESTSNVYVLDKNLKRLGKTKDLAPGERIYSVRFMGDKVYVVTFRQIDPFYVIDLKEPSSPKVMGYLKIPGYSSYLHPYDENHIIGIGMNTIDIKGRVTNEGVKISMFDITDYSSPIELDKVIIGGRGSHTDISHDHKSLLFSKEKNILSFPVYVSNYDKATYKHSFETQGAFVFKINEDYKFDLRGNISHLDSRNNHNSYVKRILFIDDKLYTVSNGKIKISDFHTLENIDELTLEIDN